MNRLWVQIISVLVGMLLLPSAVKAEVSITHRGSNNTIILFVHGLWGDPKTSFTAPGAKASWPAMMAKDDESVRGQTPLSQYSIGVLGYPTNRADKLTIPQVATRLLTELTDAGVFDNFQHIVFVAHSMGGLVVKQMLVDASTSRHPPLRQKTSMVFLVSTPSKGTPAVEFIRKLESIAGPLLVDLRPIAENTYLHDLDKQWESLLRARDELVKMRIYCAYETQPTLGVVVVPEQYTSTACDDTPFPENVDHIQIVKPASAESSIYTWVRGRLAEFRIATYKLPQVAPITYHDRWPPYPADKLSYPAERDASPGLACDKMQAFTFVSDNGVYGAKELNEKVYAELVEWEGNGKKKRATVAEETRRYKRDWPTRTYREDAISARMDGDVCQLQVVFRFDMENDNLRISGRRKAIFDITLRDKAPKIVAQRVERIGEDTREEQ